MRVNRRLADQRLHAGRFRLTQTTTTADGQAVTITGRFEKLVDDDLPSAKPLAGDTLVEVTNPITDLDPSHPREVLNPPHPDDQRPISADDIARRNYDGRGVMSLYFGRFTNDTPADAAGHRQIADRPARVVMIDTKDHQSCFGIGGGPYRPGLTTTLDPAVTCKVRSIVVVDPQAGDPLLITTGSQPRA